jgi:hypothetical protein
VRWETGKEWVVQVHYDEGGVAIYIGPEPCVGVREDGRHTPNLKAGPTAGLRKGLRNEGPYKWPDLL